ncbi:phage terminase large subunit GpA-like protein [Leptospira interrogans serovar Grippotyphosa str. 2006006986]|uniref:Phage terminase large subunit GpA-like protein n=3 Tax=Leptospira interrogans TaxID=173 RepID=A0A0E2D670_LEPIR|nr:phage terminase large subunit family protein [Leptospira interrogans]EMF44276.1 phage terminase large subunit GpA-like protein [Leptospira interrogans serovar Lora str. TE 1992]AKH77074.1 terminase [Leptospira interrogans serovar Bratislava]EKO89847.1 phage terminase large subunit GpA-like protein [Leptospira interrogans serovar Grippotyphosa str. Andaman]EKP84477.1 phage terminase large subunit GpA-like protein [Leptospira interrogans serovar Grippotyphosa str. 2006006986]EKR55489.1 phage 
MAKTKTKNAQEEFFQELDNLIGKSSTEREGTMEEFLTQNVFVKGDDDLIPYSFDGYSFWRDICRESQDHPYIIFLKAAQIGYSVWALARLVWKIFRSSYKAGIYFPDDTSMKDFVQDRVEPFLNQCPILKPHLNDSNVDNTRTKKIDKATLVMRGTWTKRGTKTVDLDIVMLDEVDEHDEENIEFVGDRLLASKLNWMMLGSQPSLPNIGIHAEFLRSDQRFRLLKCPSCGHWTNLVERWLKEPISIFGFDDKEALRNPSSSNVFYACEKCSRKLDNQKGEYVAKTKSDRRGYQCSQLFTPRNPFFIYNKLLKAVTSAKRKNLTISIIGWPDSSEEEQPIQLSDIEKYQGDQGLKDDSPYFTYHGADQGDTVHGVFGEPTLDGRIRIIGLYKGHILEEERYKETIQKFNVFQGIVDAMPNRNWALRMALRFQENLKIQYFKKRFQEKEEDVLGQDTVDVIHTNRDDSLEDTVDAIKKGLFIFPSPNLLSTSELADYEEFKSHLRMLIREKGEDENGKVIFHFKKKVPNHYGMALNSLRIAYETSGTGSGGSGYGGFA